MYANNQVKVENMSQTTDSQNCYLAMIDKRNRQQT